MNDINHSKSIEQRIQKTLEIIEERDYNITVNRLSKILIGGCIDPEQIKKVISNNPKFDCDGLFISNKGKLQSKKCLERLKRNEHLQSMYNKIAQEFIEEYTRICPWVKCVMASGTLASEGLLDGDDIDLNFVVDDNTKYVSWLFGLLLSLKYSFKYRKKFFLKWYDLIEGVICICVIWEEKETKPFKRKDEQVAYEILLSSKVLFNNQYFKSLLNKNSWLKDFFPQLYNINFKKDNVKVKNNHYNKTLINRIFNPLAKNIVFLLYQCYRSTIFWNEELIDRIDYVINKQDPYSIFSFNKR